MVKEIILTLSKDPDINAQVEELLAPLAEKIIIRRTTECQDILEEKCDLPIINTDEGDNYYGLARVKHGIERMKEELAKAEIERVKLIIVSTDQFTDEQAFNAFLYLTVTSADTLTELIGALSRHRPAVIKCLSEAARKDT